MILIYSNKLPVDNSCETINDIGLIGEKIKSKKCKKWKHEEKARYKATYAEALEDHNENFMEGKGRGEKEEVTLI